MGESGFGGGDNALILTSIAVDTSTGVAQLKKFESAVEATGKKVDTHVKKMDKLGGDGEKIKKTSQEMSGLGSTLDRLGLSWGKLAGAASAYFIGIASFGAIKSFFTTAIHEAMASEVAVNELSLALKAQGKNVDAVLPSLKELAVSLSRVSTQSDEAVMGVEKTLIAIGGLSGAKLEEATKATLDLAKGMGIGVDGAARIMAKAAEGVIGPLRRYGLHVKAGADESEKFAAVLDFVRKKFGGFAAGELDTTSGAISRMTTDWGELKEAMGGAILKFTNAKDGAKEASSVFQALADEIELADKGGLGFWQSLILLTAGGPGSIPQLTAHAMALKASLAPLPQALDAAGEAAVIAAKKQQKWVEALEGAEAKTKNAVQELAWLKESLKGTESPVFVKTTADIAELNKQIASIGNTTQMAVNESVAYLGQLGIKMSEIGPDGNFKFTDTPEAVAKQQTAPKLTTPTHLMPLGIQPDKKVAPDALIGTGEQQADLLKDRIRLLLQAKDIDLKPITAQLLKLSATIAGMDDKSNLPNVIKRIKELEGAGFQGDLLQAKVKAAEPGSPAAEKAQLDVAVFQDKQKLEDVKSDPTKTGDINKLIQAQLISRQAMIDGFNKARLDKEAGFEQQLLDLKASTAAPGSDAQFAAEIEAFDNKVNAEYAKVAASGAKTDKLIEGYQLQRDAKFLAHADARLAIEQDYAQRAIQVHVQKQGATLEEELAAARESFDYKANLEVEAADKAGRDTTELYKLLIAEREALDAGYTEKAVQIEKDLQEKLMQVRMGALTGGFEQRNQVALEAYVADAQAQWEAFRGTEEQREQLGQALNDGYATLAEQQAQTAENMYQQIINWSSLATDAQVEDLNTMQTAVSGAANIMLSVWGKLATAVRGWATMEKNDKLTAIGAVLQATGAAVQQSFGKTKAGQYAATIINTAGAIMSAMTLPPPASFVFAALAGAMGAVQLAKIKSTTLEGGGGGSSSVPAMPALNYETAKGQGTGNTATGTNPMLVGVDSSTATQAPKSGVTINVELHALDAKDVRTYLTSPEIRAHVVEAYDLQTSRG